MLYLDLGNSLLKIGFLNTNKELEIEKIPVDKIDENILNSKLKEIKNKGFFFINAYFSSVKPEKNIIIENVLKENNIKIHQIKNEVFKLTDLIISNQINLSEIGTDILLNAFYAAKQFKSAIIVSLGTATVISKIYKKEIEGVVIFPGIEKGLNSLFNSTSQINKINLNNKIDKAIGTNTVDALSIGIINGNYFAIKGLIEQMNKENLPVFFTGGNIKYLKNKIKEKQNIIEEMVIKSLKLLAESCIIE
ncbi:type III pantothenate kinase [Mycoplasma sp. 480]|uniref:type III pantothenate kinase n=1 Tax=Mycoplasma sp. 480 TaxID=3440155 RepID=UPI003F51703B